MSGELTLTESGGDFEAEPLDNETRSLATVMAEGDPELMLAHLEKKAELAARWRTAIETILVSQTYPGDWTMQGDKACLSSAGAERIARNFPIRTREVKKAREEFTDKNGKAYRYVYTGYACMNDREVFVQGSYSTRDKFLGKAGGAWKPIEDINENDIRSAAYHIFCGNCVKALLGLRGLPAAEYTRIMGGSGQDVKKTSTVTRGAGTSGGSSEDDHRHQKELGEMCVAFAHAACTVGQDEGGEWHLVSIGEADERGELEIAKEICEKLSSFEGDKGTVKGKNSAKQLKGKWLNATLGKARKLKEELAKMGSNDSQGGFFN